MFVLAFLLITALFYLYCVEVSLNSLNSLNDEQFAVVVFFLQVNYKVMKKDILNLFYTTLTQTRLLFHVVNIKENWTFRCIHCFLLSMFHKLQEVNPKMRQDCGTVWDTQMDCTKRRSKLARLNKVRLIGALRRGGGGGRRGGGGGGGSSGGCGCGGGGSRCCSGLQKHLEEQLQKLLLLQLSESRSGGSGGCSGCSGGLGEKWTEEKSHLDQGGLVVEYF